MENPFDGLEFESKFDGAMFNHALLIALYNEPDISTYVGFEVHIPVNNIIRITSDYPPDDYREALHLAFVNGYYPLIDSSVKNFVNDGGFLGEDGIME